MPILPTGQLAFAQERVNNEGVALTNGGGGGHIGRSSRELDISTVKLYNCNH